VNTQGLTFALSRSFLLVRLELSRPLFLRIGGSFPEPWTYRCVLHGEKTFFWRRTEVFRANGNAAWQRDRLMSRWTGSSRLT
jgi:hypothetical protein